MGREKEKEKCQENTRDEQYTLRSIRITGIFFPLDTSIRARTFVRNGGGVLHYCVFHHGWN